MLTDVERDWLDYAWRVVTCPAEHLSACVAAGGAVSGPGRVDGNELRWPGYVGRRWEPGRGVLCVGAVHREPNPLGPEDEDLPINRTTRELTEATRAWQSGGRSPQGDEAYLRAVQLAYVDGLPTWPRWNRHFKSLVEVHLGMRTEEIAWTNLAKCRVPINRDSDKVVRLCQQRFSPIADLVATLRPAAVLCSVLNAKAGGGIVESWDSPTWSPIVFTWQGQSGHDRHNTDPKRRAFSGWAPEAAAMIRARQSR